MPAMMEPGEQPGVRSFLPRASREFGLPAKRQGSVARPTYNADPPLLGLAMVGACIPKQTLAALSPSFEIESKRHSFSRASARSG